MVGLTRSVTSSVSLICGVTDITRPTETDFAVVVEVTMGAIPGPVLGMTSLSTSK